jgi:hypothetical protein
MVGAQRGSNLVMMAAADGNAEVTAETSGDDKSEALIDGKIETQDEKNKRIFKPGYAYFVLFLVLMARIMVQW